MKQAAEFLNPSNETESTKKPTTKSLPQEWVAGIFETMRLRYGNLWTKQIGEEKKQIQKHMQEWGKLLCSCDAEQIKFGLESWSSEFPPNVMQFRTACKSINGRWPQHRQYKLDRRLPDLGKKKRTAKIASSELAKIREKIHG